MATDEYSLNDGAISFSTYDGITSVADDGRYSLSKGSKMSWSTLKEADLSEAAKQWVELADMPYYVNSGEMKRIVPGTFPRFEHAWTSSSYKFSSIDSSNTTNLDSEAITIKKDANTLTINDHSYSADNFEDKALPKWILIGLIGGGGAGGKGQVFAGDDGDGGGAGGFCMLALSLIENAEYRIEVGEGAERNTDWKQHSGQNTLLHCNGDMIACAYGGAGGTNYNHPGAGGAATIAESAYVKKIACIAGGDGGDGDHNTGKGGSVSPETISLLAKGSAADHLYRLQLPGGTSPKSKAGTEGHDIGYTGSGGGSILADGGAGGDNIDGDNDITSLGNKGSYGSGGGGGRYAFIVTWGDLTDGAAGGDGFAMIFC